MKNSPNHQSQQGFINFSIFIPTPVTKVFTNIRNGWNRAMYMSSSTKEHTKIAKKIGLELLGGEPIQNTVNTFFFDQPKEVDEYPTFFFAPEYVDFVVMGNNPKIDNQYLELVGEPLFKTASDVRLHQPYTVRFFYKKYLRDNINTHIPDEDFVE